MTSPGAGAFDRVVRNSGWLIGAYVLAFGLAFVQNVLLARSLGPAEFGLLAVVIFLVTFVQLLVGSRVWEAATTFVVRYRAHGDAARATATVKLCCLVDAIGAGVGALLLLALAAPASRIFGDGTIAGPIRLYALSLLLAIQMATASAPDFLSARYHAGTLTRAADRRGAASSGHAGTCRGEGRAPRAPPRICGGVFSFSWRRDAEH